MTNLEQDEQPCLDGLRAFFLIEEVLTILTTPSADLTSQYNLFFIPAIKHVRDKTGFGLVESKQLVDAVRDEVNGDRPDAIKRWREQMGTLGLESECSTVTPYYTVTLNRDTPTITESLWRACHKAAAFKTSSPSSGAEQITVTEYESQQICDYYSTLDPLYVFFPTRQAAEKFACKGREADIQLTFIKDWSLL